MPISFEQPVLRAGVESVGQGIVLQRGGEELLLEKVGDRFTACPVANISLNELANQIGAEAFAPLPALSLVEFTIASARLESAMQEVRAAQEVVFASHVYRMPRSPGAVFYLTNQLTVQFAATVSAERMQALAIALGLQVLKLVPGVPKTFVFQVTRRAAANPIKLANQLMRYPEVLLAEPNIAVAAQSFGPAEEEAEALQWHLDHSGGDDLATGSHIAAAAAWQLTRGSRSIVVAVVDDGVDLRHPDFQGKDKVIAPKALPADRLSQSWQHGTRCARIAVGEGTSGLVGVAPGCALMPIAMGNFLDDQAIEQICEWAIEQGAAVVCCGWGASAVYFPLSLRQRVALARAATQGRQGKGCVLVFAAGNANRPLDGTVYEQGEGWLQGPTEWLNGFALHPDVIAVAASTSLNQKAACSNWGVQISIAAPGGNQVPGLFLPTPGYTATLPLILAALPGRGVEVEEATAASPAAPALAAAQLGSTSTACAIVAGVAALVLSANPDLMAEQVKHILQASADKIVDLQADGQLGLQGGTYSELGHSLWFGYGKVNAFKAVQMAQQKRTARQLPHRWIERQSTTLVDIPDNFPQGVTSRIQIDDPSFVCDLEVSLELEHSFMGDVEVYLISPSGNQVLLQNRTLGRLSALKKTYSLHNTPLLRQLLGQPAAGAWQLKLVDRALLDTGCLRQWGLKLGL